MHLGRSLLVPSRFSMSHHEARGTYLRGIFHSSCAYVPAARPVSVPLSLSYSWSEYLVVAPFASVNHGLNKIAYPRESNEMSAPGPPPSPRPGPNCSRWFLRLPLPLHPRAFVAPASGEDDDDNGDRCIRSRAGSSR